MGDQGSVWCATECDVMWVPQGIVSGVGASGHSVVPQGSGVGAVGIVWCGHYRAVWCGCLRMYECLRM